MTTLLDDGNRTMCRTAQQSYLHDHLRRMHDEIEATTRKLELEKRRLNKLEEDVGRARTEHSEKVLKAPTKDGKSGPTLKKLEHRLAKAIGQLNLYARENKEVRDKIDSIRRERLQMNQVFKKMQGEINENMSQVTQLQRDTDASRREQEERISRAMALKKQLELERKEFKKIVHNLQKDMKDAEREELSQRINVSKDSVDVEDGDKGKSRSRGLKADEEDNFNSSAVMRRILKLSFLNAIQRRRIKQHQKNIEVFEQAFLTIKSTTGISDIEEIVKIFVGLEQRNFSLLTYANNLNREIESFEKRNHELEEQLSTQKRTEEESDSKRTSALAELKTQIASTTKVTDENQQQATQQLQVLEQCKPLIEHILRTVEKENRGFGGKPAPELSGDEVLGWLTYIEKTLTQWKDFLPEAKDSRAAKPPSKTYKYTVGAQVMALQPKKSHYPQGALVRAGELPSAANAFLEQGAQQRAGGPLREDDSETDEEELSNRVLSRQEVRDKAIQSVARRKRNRKIDTGAAAQGAVGAMPAEVMRGAGADADAAVRLGGADAQEDIGYEELVEKGKDGDEESWGSDDLDFDDAGPTDEEINEIFLKRYKMTKEELQGMADKMGIQLNNLCYLKQEFDAYDEDRSGYIDVKELKGLLEKLGEELSQEELDQAFKELDSDGSGEIEFFEFVEWFTSED